MKRLSVLTLLLTLAQAEVVLEPLHVTAATNSDQLVTELPENVTIITAEDLEESHATTLPEALSRLAGIAFSNNGGLGKSTSMFLRGFDSKRTLLLINGVRYNNPTSLNGAEFQDITLDDIERIEIIKGAQSGIWGADASAGVINIITKKAKKGTKLFANAEEGSYGFHKTAISLSHQNDTFDIKFSSSQIKSEGFSASAPNFGEAGYGTATNELTYEKDSYTNATTDLTLGYDLGMHDRLEASYRTIDAYVEYDDYNYTSGYSVDAINFYNRTKNKFTTVGYRHDGETNDFSLLYALSDFDNDQYGGYTGNVQEVTLKEKLTYTDNSFLQVGANYQRYEQLLSAGSDLNKSYNVYAFYLTNYNKFGSTILSESIRNDTFSTFGSTTTGKLGLKQFIINNYFISANYGSGYNAPTLFNLYSFYGNATLTPESTLNSELAIGNEHFNVGYFYNKVSNLIDYDFATSKYQNIVGISIFQGAEFSYNDSFLNLFDIGLNYTYLDVKDAAGLPLARRPQHQADLRLTYTPSLDLSFLTHIQYIGKRYDKANNSGVQTGEYTVVNLAANYSFDKSFKAYIKLDNLFDTFYQVVDGYSTAGRSGYIGISASY